MKDSIYHFRVNMAGNIWHIEGNILRETNDFISVNDNEVGEIDIFKEYIITKHKVISK